MDSSEDLHEGGLARAVFPDDGQDFPSPEREIDVPEHRHGGKGLADSPHFEKAVVHDAPAFHEVQFSMLPSKATEEGAKFILRTKARDSRAPNSRSMPLSSHSTERGP